MNILKVKTNNIFHYKKSNPEHVDYDSDIDFNLSYVKPNTHILYDKIQPSKKIIKYIDNLIK